MKRQHTRLTAYRLRRCRTMHHCIVCQRTITLGEWYYDGGYGRRAPRLCAENYER